MIYIYKGGYQTLLEQAMQTPGSDPSVLIPLMSAVTEHSGFVFTQSILNVTHVISPGSYEDFADGLAPELRKRGLLKTEYRPGTLREKLYGQGDRLKADHPIFKRELSY